MADKNFSVEEAEALIPELTRWMNEVRLLKRRLEEKSAAWHRGDFQAPADQAIAQGHVKYLLSEISHRLDAVTRTGAVPKDLDLGLVDFPSRLAGRGPVYLCWKVGEDNIRYWHGVSEGLANRKPLFPEISFLDPSR
jgi:hypothetical protein